MTPDNALQAGVYSRLNGYAPLTAVIGTDKVFDFVPESAQPPYALIGEDTLTNWDTKTERGWEFAVTIHAWSYESAGRKQVKTVLGHIYDALHRQEANVTVSGFTLVQIQWDGFQQTFQETAGEGQTDRYYHGVTRYRAVVQES